MLTITLDRTDDSALGAVNTLLHRLQDMRPVLAEIGEDMVESTKRRFATSTAPDGSAWAPNSSTTLGLYSGLFGKSLRNKDGSLNQRGEQRLAGKKPLIGQSRSLSSQINYQVSGAGSVTIGSPMVYAAMQQYGGTKTQFPHLWGSIPARPFLGASDADRENIARLVHSYLAGG